MINRLIQDEDSASIMPTCTDNEVHLWPIKLNTLSPQRQFLWDLLSPDERERASRFQFHPDCDRFTITRGCLRLLLGRYVDIAPAALQFCYGTYGKPALQSVVESNLSFNVSHSHNWALIAVRAGQPVGVDLEQIQPNYSWHTVASQVLSSREHTILEALPKAAQCSAFFKIWTCKEAFVKATGQGLSSSLTEFSVLEEVGTPQMTLILEESFKSNREWVLHSLSLISNYSAAVATVATVGKPLILRCYYRNDALFSV